MRKQGRFVVDMKREVWGVPRATREVFAKWRNDDPALYKLLHRAAWRGFANKGLAAATLQKIPKEHRARFEVRERDFILL